jgi:prolyl-tRNA synthetase
MGVPLTGAAEHIDKLLRDIQTALFTKAKTFRDERIRSVDSYDDFKKQIEEPGFLSAHWDGTRETEDLIQQETKATIRCIPFNSPDEVGQCVRSGKPSARRVMFARAY